MEQTQKDNIIKKLIDTHTTVSTMESCTSGMIASTITDTEGASAIFPGGNAPCNAADGEGSFAIRYWHTTALDCKSSGCQYGFENTQRSTGNCSDMSKNTG